MLHSCRKVYEIHQREVGNRRLRFHLLITSLTCLSLRRGNNIGIGELCGRLLMESTIGFVLPQLLGEDWRQAAAATGIFNAAGAPIRFR